MAETYKRDSRFHAINEVLLNYADTKNKKNITIVESSSGLAASYYYKEVLELSNSVFHALKKKHICEGDRVLVILPTSIGFITSFFGILLAGGISVPLAPQGIGTSSSVFYLNRIEHIIQDCRPRYVILDDEQIRYLPLIELLSSIDGLGIINISNLEKTNTISEYVFPEADDICFIQYTSGSTGNPKGVPLTHKNLIVNVNAISKASIITKKDVCVSWLPLYHDMGFIGGFLVPFLNGIPVVLFPPDFFVFRPILWLSYITEYRGTISPCNNFALLHCIKRIPDTSLEKLDLSSWRVAYNGSEPISMYVIRAFFQKFKSVGYRAETMLPCYGLAEGTLAVTFSSAIEQPVPLLFSRESFFTNNVALPVNEPENSIELVSVGSAVENVDIRIVDATGDDVSTGCVGEIIIKGFSVIDGYYCDSEKEKAEYIKDQWLYTGDLGFFHNSMLFIFGRKKELIIIRGKNYSPVDIENFVMACLSDKISGCVAFGYLHEVKQEEVLAIVYELRKANETLNCEITDLIERSVLNEFSVRVENVIRTNRILKTLNGKIIRTGCYEKYILNTTGG